MFLFWLVPYSLIGGKWLRYTLSVMPFVYMFAAVGVVGLIRFVQKHGSKRVSLAISAAVVLLFVGGPGWIAFANGPHYALYTNALAANKAGYLFPHDEFYDDGLREAIRFVCEEAPNGATMAHETPGVAGYYLSQFNRPDLKSQAISSPEFECVSPADRFTLSCSEAAYFENREELDYVRANFRRVHEVTINGASAVEVL